MTASIADYVRYEPPYTRSGGLMAETRQPLLRGPALVRSPSRWHRIRSGTAYYEQGGRRVAAQLWCGQSVHLSRGPATATHLPEGDPLCGTCEGRAIGAGHPSTGAPMDIRLRFDPASSKPRPAVCPATGPRGWSSDWCPPMRSGGLLMLRLRGHFPCPACGELTKLRAAGGPYSSHAVLQSHDTGPQLVEPCPFHRWDRLTLTDDLTVRCGCGRDMPGPS